MTDEQFETAKRLKNLITNYERKIKESEKLLKDNYSYIQFCNANVSIENVSYDENDAFIKTAIKIAIVDFKESLSKYKEELEKV